MTMRVAVRGRLYICCGCEVSVSLIAFSAKLQSPVLYLTHSLLIASPASLTSCIRPRRLHVPTRTIILTSHCIKVTVILSILRLEMARFLTLLTFSTLLLAPVFGAPAASTDFQQQNGLDAQKLNAQFATLKATDACQGELLS